MLRDDIPINLPSSYKDEALGLRNKLLLYRFRNYGKAHEPAEWHGASIEPRLKQIFSPLISVVSDKGLRAELEDLAGAYHEEIVADRSLDVEAQVLDVVRDLAHRAEPLSVKSITDRFTARFGGEYDRRPSPKWIGGILHKKLHIATERTGGIYVISRREGPKLRHLYRKYGLENKVDRNVDFGDVGDVAEGSVPKS